MNNSIINRRHVAAVARDYLEKKITWQKFVDEVDAYRDDELIDELVDLIWHEPKHGGFLGVREKEWQRYQREIQGAIDLLEK